MTSKELKVLEILNKDSSSTQRDIAEKADISVGNVNYIIKSLLEQEMIKIQKISRKPYYIVTEKGIEALEEYLKTSIDKKIIIPQGEGKRVKQAVILAAGQRAGFNLPVGFLQLGDTTVIERTINVLKDQGIEKIIIITGYESSYYEELAERCEVQLVKNEKYKHSGTMYSLALVKELVDEDFILIESDLIFEEKAIAEIINNENRDCVLITAESGSGDEVLVEIRNGFLYKISKDIHAFSNIEGELIGITKISIDIYHKMLEDFRNSNNAYQNYEYVLLDVARTYNIGYVKLEDLIWTEIDTTRDYKNLTNYVYPILKKKENQFKHAQDIERKCIKVTREQFSILYALHRNNLQSQQELADVCDLQLESVKEELKFLEDKQLVEGYSLTALGNKALDEYKVDNAIIMAAGMSSRFVPLSYELPKGLLEVKGERLIERQIKQLREAGIEEIIVVVGYMKEKFFYLEDKYNVKIIVNNDYYKRNNNSTLYAAQKYLKNSYICSSDNYFTANVFEPYVYDSFYSAVYEAGVTDEYCITADSSDKITEVNIGGKDEWVMLGHCYFSRSFSKKFLEILLREYNEVAVDQMLWEDIYMRHINALDMYIRRYKNDEIFEFDTLEDLRAFDPKYINSTGSKIIQNICKVLQCTEEEVENIEPIKKGLTNTSFLFECKGKKYVYRNPGAGTEEIINRLSEAKSQNLAKELGLDDTLIYISAEEGWKISHYIENCIDFDYHNMDHVSRGLALVKKLHDSNSISNWDFNIYDEAEKLVKLTSRSKNFAFDDFEELRASIKELYNLAEQDGIAKRICHNDCYDPNFLTNGEVMYLIDWEYSGNSDPASDLGTFICCSDYTTEEALEILKIYFGRELTEVEKRHYLAYVAISGYYWFVWALYKESVGEIVGEYLYIWYKYAKTYSKIALKLYTMQ